MFFCYKRNRKNSYMGNLCLKKNKFYSIKDIKMENLEQTEKLIQIDQIVNIEQVVNNEQIEQINQIEILKKMKNEDISDFSMNGVCTLCKIVDIYDADTFRVVFFINKNDKTPIKMKVRANGCNAAELHPLKSHPDRDEEIRKAKIAKNRLFQLITGIDFDITNIDIFESAEFKKILNVNSKLLYIEFGDFDKYGRVLGTLYPGENKEKSINQMLIDENHSVYYDGGKRNKNQLTVS